MNIAGTTANLFQYFGGSSSTNKLYNNDVSNNLVGNDSTEIDKEEDEILYNKLKAAGVDLTNHSLEWQKEHLKGFPPLTAPGNVRRAYREAVENATPVEKEASKSLMFYMMNYENETGDNSINSDNSVKGYSNLMSNFKNYFTSYKSILDKGKYDATNSFLDSFGKELSKYL